MGRWMVAVLLVALPVAGCTGDSDGDATPVSTRPATPTTRPAEMAGADVAIRLYELTLEQADILEEWLTSVPGRRLFDMRVRATLRDPATQSIYIYLTRPLSELERRNVYRTLHEHPAVARLDFYVPEPVPS